MKIEDFVIGEKYWFITSAYEKPIQILITNISVEDNFYSIEKNVFYKDDTGTYGCFIREIGEKANGVFQTCGEALKCIFETLKGNQKFFSHKLKETEKLIEELKPVLEEYK